MPYWQYAQHHKLDAGARAALRVIKPVCLECGQRLMRLAMRETFYPYGWIGTGWLCPACSAVYVEET